MIVIKRKRERAVTLPAKRDPHPALLLFPLCWNMIHSLYMYGLLGQRECA